MITSASLRSRHALAHTTECTRSHSYRILGIISSAVRCGGIHERSAARTSYMWLILRTVNFQSTACVWVCVRMLRRKRNRAKRKRIVATGKLFLIIVMNVMIGAHVIDLLVVLHVIRRSFLRCVEDSHLSHILIFGIGVEGSSSSSDVMLQRKSNCEPPPEWSNKIVTVFAVTKIIIFLRKKSIGWLACECLCVCVSSVWYSSPWPQAHVATIHQQHYY